MHILESLWWDYAAERLVEGHREEQQKHLNAAIELEDQFQKELSEAGREAYRKSLLESWNAQSYGECDAFVLGWRCGALLMLDILS
ncbi:MAG: hypothetical protein E7442_04545 [Ruminococcaceae bacterium]|nr:hypothetical protein [Oscillospiraceae bacterium]